MPAKKTRPDFVARLGPRVGIPSGSFRPVAIPNGPVSCTVPIGTCQTSLWVFRSIADIVPNGGVPLKHAGEWLGAIGVSGVSSDKDAAIAMIGARLVNGSKSANTGAE